MADDWMRAGRRQGNRPGTELAYSWATKHFVAFLAERGVNATGQLQGEHIEAFQDWLIATGKSRSSQRIASSVLRELLRWAGGRRLVSPELFLVVARVRAPRGTPRPLDEDDLRHLLIYLLPRRPRMSLVEARDRALFLYLLGSSARVSEALQVTRREFERAWVIQKGGGHQLLLAPPIVVEAVNEYLALRRDASEWLWVTLDTNRPIRRITPEGVRPIWVRLARKVGAKHFTTHQIRHTAATVMMDRDVRDSIIATHLGHSNLSTLANYAKVRPKRRQEALDALQGFIEDTILLAQEPGPQPLVRKDESGWIDWTTFAG